MTIHVGRVGNGIVLTSTEAGTSMVVGRDEFAALFNAIKRGAYDSEFSHREYIGPNGAERPGEHWNARLIREAAEREAAERQVTLEPSQGQDIPDDQLSALGRQPRPLADHMRHAYRVGYAAALGYQITVTKDGVQIGDRPEPTPQPAAPERPVDLVDEPILPDLWQGLRDRVAGEGPLGDVGKCPTCGHQSRSYSRGCSWCGHGRPAAYRPDVDGILRSSR